VAAGEVMFPAVGRLIFASCPKVSLRTGSHGFDSPRPCPQSRLGSHLPKECPITSSRVGHRTHPLHLVCALNVMSWFNAGRLFSWYSFAG
jgi:hypothetical protein